MASDLPFMKLWVKDLLEDIQKMGLTDEEFGAYMKLLLISWLREGIHADVKENARYVSASPGRLKTLWKSFKHKWVPHGEVLVNPRQELEREDAKGKSKSAAESANARWEKVRREKAEREEEHQAA